MTANSNYNCIAWAAGQDEACWWPSDDDRGFWPAAVAREEAIAAFQAVGPSLK